MQRRVGRHLEARQDHRSDRERDEPGDGLGVGQQVGGSIGTVGMMFALSEPYRRERLIGFLDPSADTAGAGYDEVWNELMDSRENEGEAQLVLRLWSDLEAAGIRPADFRSRNRIRP